MYFFSFAAEQSKEAVLCKLEYCRADAGQGGLFYEQYAAKRVGFHLQRKGNWFFGFYENGRKSSRTRRRGRKARTWMIAKLTETDTGVRFSGSLFFSPLVMGVLVYLLLAIGNAWRHAGAEGIAGSLLMLVFVALFGIVIIRDTTEAYGALEQLFKE